MSEPFRGETPPPPPPIQDSISSGSRSGSRSSSGRGSQSLKSLTRLLGDEREAKEWKELIQKLHDQLQLERRRAEDGERRLVELASHLKTVNDARLQALRDVARLNEELKLYEIQFDKAQKEIYRAQDVLKIVDDQRYLAEKDAATARSTARKLKEEIAVYEAREEGRRLGLQEGLRRGREVGYEEGRRMAEAERRARYDSDSQDSVEEERSRSLETNETVERQARSRPRSSTPSTAPPRPPTTVSGVSVAVPAPSLSAQPVPPIPEEPVNIRPRSVRNHSPSPRIPTSAIPPDNFIPHLDGDNRIRIPPPFEFSRLPPSPERQHPPVLPTMLDDEVPRMIPPPVATSLRSQHYRPSSPASASTTLSQMDIVNDPHTGGNYAPMAAIPEVRSTRGSPNPQEPGMRRQSSVVSTQSSRILSGPLNNPDLVYTRSRAASGSSVSYQPPPVSEPRTSASTSTAPNISVQPPSTSTSRFSNLPGGHTHGTSIHSHSNLDDSEPFLPPMPETSPQATGPMSLPGNQLIQSVYAARIPMDSANEPPVIPGSDVYANPDDDDAISSGMGSMESLTTPPAAHDQALPNRWSAAGGGGTSFVSGNADGSVIGSGSGRAGEDRWAGIARMAAREPIRSVAPATGGTKTPSNKGRPLSRSTNRSGQ